MKNILKFSFLPRPISFFHCPRPIIHSPNFQIAFMNSYSSLPYLQGLSEAQRDAVISDSPVLLINAGPGSGKTKVLTSRVAHFVLNHKVHPSRIAVLTFTNKAASEMKHRIASMIGEDRSKFLLMGTFHSFCNRILRQYGKAIDLNPRFTILDRSDSTEVIKKLLKQQKILVNSKTSSTYLDRISKYKNKNLFPEDIVKQECTLEHFYTIYQDYQNILRDTNSLDFEDLLVLGYRLLRSNNEIPASIFRVLIDEYQDTNFLQNEIALKLCSAHSHLTVVLDPDQSIYAWRCAEIENFHRLRQHYPNSNLVKLEENFRSTKSILSFANLCISQDTSRLPKTLYTHNPDGPPVYVRGKKSPTHEAAFVAERIAYFVEEGQGVIEYKDFAILVRASSLTRVLEQELTRSKIPFKMVGGVRFYDRTEVKDMLAYLKVLQNPYDYNALSRIINVPPRKIGPSTVLKLETAAKTLNIPVYEVLSLLLEKKSVPGFTKVASPLLDFAQLLQTLQKEKDTAPLPMILKTIVDRTDYFDFLEKYYKDDYQDRIGNVNELLQNAAEFVAVENPVSEFLEMVCLYSEEALMSNQDANSSASGAVTISTLHASKGLEWPFVFIIGAHDGCIPHAFSFKSEEIDEERRLLYVGITRAKTLLHITWAKKRPSITYDNFTIPSRFLDPYFNSNPEIKKICTKRVPKLTNKLFEAYKKTSGKQMNVIHLFDDSSDDHGSTSESEDMSDEDFPHEEGAYKMVHNFPSSLSSSSSSSPSTSSLSSSSIDVLPPLQPLAEKKPNISGFVSATSLLNSHPLSSSSFQNSKSSFKKFKETK